MKKSKLTSLAAFTLAAGAMAAPAQAIAAPSGCVAPSDSQRQWLFNQLDPQHQAMYDSMDCETKKLAMQVATQKCKGQNQCKGLNVCKTPATDDCAGNGDCKGTTPGPFTNKNEAVEVAAKYMANKRSQAMN